MKRITFILLSLLATTWLSAQTTWHYPLYMDRGEPAKKRIEVKITNNTDKFLEERVLFLSAEKLGIVGQRVDSLRVVSQKNRELLFSIAPYGKIVEKDAVLTIPFFCDAKETASIYIYFDNKKANEVPDFYLFGSLNEDFEQPESETFRRWERTDPEVERRSLSKTTAHTGKQSAYLKPGKDWCAFRRQMQINEGAEYLFEGWVKAENMKNPQGTHIGFYLAFSYDTENKFFKHNGKLEGSKKDIVIPSRELHQNSDWTKITKKFKVPVGYTRLIIKTKSHTDADTYFDDIKITEIKPSPDFSYQIMPVEELKFTVDKAPRNWEVSRSKYDVRITASFFNLTQEPKEKVLGTMPIKRITQGNFPTSDFKVFKDGKLVKCGVFGDRLIFCIDKIDPMSETQYNIYLKADRRNQNIKTTGAKQASYIPSDQVAEVRNIINPKDVSDIFASSNNLLRNGDFEEGLANWKYRGVGDKITSIVDDQSFGKKALRLKLDKEQKHFPGIEQIVPAKHNTSYIGIILGKNIGNVAQTQAPVLKFAEKGTRNNIVREATLISNGEWEVQALTAQNPYRKANLSFIILSKDPKDFLFDNAFLCESTDAYKFTYSTADDYVKDERTRIWQVNSIVKVFPFFASPQKVSDAKISLAKNEYENLQLAIRSNKNLGELQISAPAPTHKDDSSVSLKIQELGKVGLVAVDNMSSYDMFTYLKFYERCVPPASRLEFYPDPLIPTKSITIKKNKTESIHLSFKADENTKAGIYNGVVELKKGDKVVASIPYQVEVRNFAIPTYSNLTAMFTFQGTSSFGRWRKITLEPGMTNRFYDRTYVQNYINSKRITLDTSYHPFVPKPRGQVDYDFKDFDKFCELALNKQKVKLLYLPLPIPMLNWARPLPPLISKDLKVVSPIEGEWPFHGKDLSKISPEYVKIIQERVKVIYDHIVKKGWQDRFIFFISDEPYYWRKPIANMLNRYCDIVREVAPEIKIYSSSWGYTETLKNGIDAWGLNISAANTPKEIEELDKQKNKLKIFTTDGNYCIDTPFNAQERIMSLYCYAGGFVAYEYWGTLWNTQNPFKWAVHKDRISDSDPTNVRRNRYPNGDGYFIYNGEFIGKKELYTSIRLESIRDGQEDYEYYVLLETLAKKHNDADALKLLEEVKSFAVYPNAGGRKSAEFLPNPEVIQILRDKVAEHIERLSK